MVLITSLGNSGAKMNSISHMDNMDSTQCTVVAIVGMWLFWTLPSFGNRAQETVGAQELLTA